MKGWSPVFTLANAGSDLKISEAVRYLGRVQSVPHAMQGGTAEHIKALCPEAICPMYGINAGVHHPGVAAPAHIRQSVVLCKCSRDGGGS